MEIKSLLSHRIKCRVENIYIFISSDGYLDFSCGLLDEFDIMKIISKKSVFVKHLGISQTFESYYSNHNEEIINTLNYISRSIMKFLYVK